jgi:PPP family 3-phenylpropionic acid transporter
MAESRAVPQDKKRGIQTLKLLQFIQLAGWGAFSVFFPLYLKECGISYTEMGIIIGVPAFIGIFTGVMWGLFSDIIGRRKPFLVQASFVMALFTFAVTLVSSFGWFLLLGVVSALFVPLVLELIVTSWFRASTYPGRATSFSSLAIWGAVGWAVATALAGVAAFFFGPKSAMYFASILYLLATVFSLWIPESRETQRTSTGRNQHSTFARRFMGYFAPLREVMKNRKMLILLLTSLPLAVAMNAFRQFFSVYLGFLGGSFLLIGLVFAIPALIEVPVFLRAGKLSDRLGARKPLLVFSSAMYSLIFFIVFLVPIPLLILILYSLLAPLAWPPFYTGTSTLISEIVPRKSWVTGQTLFSIWMWSIAGLIGPLVGGIISDAWGLSSTLVVASLLAAVSSLLYFLIIKEK